MIKQPEVHAGVQERHCAHCGDKFTTRHAQHHYCSVRCRREAGPKAPNLAAALSMLATPVAGAPAGVLGLAARIDRMSEPHVLALLDLTGALVGRARI